jgi:hypothetical protein
MAPVIETCEPQLIFEETNLWLRECRRQRGIVWDSQDGREGYFLWTSFCANLWLAQLEIQ